MNTQHTTSSTSAWCINNHIMQLLIVATSLLLLSTTHAFTLFQHNSQSRSISLALHQSSNDNNMNNNAVNEVVPVSVPVPVTTVPVTVPPSRRSFLTKSLTSLATITTITSSTQLNDSILPSTPYISSSIGGGTAQAGVGPVKLRLENPKYFAQICPPDRPIPGEKAMKGMKGVCVTVDADLAEISPKDLEKVGVYGFVTDDATGNSVLANNPDLSTDAGQFAMIETITPSTKKVQFEFIAAVPKDKDLSKEENGIGQLNFGSLRVISFPGGQQYGAISPCEYNEFSAECDEWEEENGPYKKGNFMVQSNERTKGR